MDEDSTDQGKSVSSNEYSTDFMSIGSDEFQLTVERATDVARRLGIGAIYRILEDARAPAGE